MWDIQPTIDIIQETFHITSEKYQYQSSTFMNTSIFIKTDHKIYWPKYNLLTWVQISYLVPSFNVIFPTYVAPASIPLILIIILKLIYIPMMWLSPSDHPNFDHTKLAFLKTSYNFIIVFHHLLLIFHDLNISKRLSKYTQYLYPFPGSFLVLFST